MFYNMRIFTFEKIHVENYMILLTIANMELIYLENKYEIFLKIN